MAVDTQPTTHSAEQVSGARRFLVGTNVVVATVLVLAIVVIVQLAAYQAHRHFQTPR